MRIAKITGHNRHRASNVDDDVCIALLGREKQRQDRRTSCTRLAIRKNMRDRDRFDYVICHLAALKAFCFAVVASYPDRQTLGVCITAM
jgi:hypothetical protein